MQESQLLLKEKSMYGEMAEDMDFIDFHTHSNASDGTDTPTELVDRAKQVGLTALALTDHDTLSGLDEAEDACNKAKIRFIRGCEISTRNELGEFHILGLWMPRNNPFLKSFIDDARKRRFRRNHLMLEKLRQLGLNISMDDVLAQTSGMGGRPHMAKLLVEKGYVQDRAEAFAKYLGREGKAFVPKLSPAPHTVVQVLAQAGATAVLAHPFLYSLPPVALERLLRQLSARGLSAVEAHYSFHNWQQTGFLCKLAARLGLGVSGGSDYHGNAKPAIQLGTGRGNLKISGKVLTGLLAMRAARGLPC